MTIPRYDLLLRYQNSPTKLREASQSDPAVRAEVEAELAALPRIDEQRCVMTKEYRQMLRDVLTESH